MCIRDSPVEPHMAMRGLGFNMVGDSLMLSSQFCCECNLCLSLIHISEPTRPY